MMVEHGLMTSNTLLASLARGVAASILGRPGAKQTVICQHLLSLKAETCILNLCHMTFCPSRCVCFWARPMSLRLLKLGLSTLSSFDSEVALILFHPLERAQDLIF